MDFTRNEIISNKEVFDKKVLILGVGATGSHLAIELVKLGFNDITIYDNGVVKEHNVTNQAYPIGAVGELKQEALAKLLKVRYGFVATVELTPPTDTYDIIFNCVDAADARLQYRGLQFNDLFIETAFDVYSSDFYAVDNKQYIRHLPLANTTEQTSEVVSACGSRLTVSASVNALVSSLTWFVIDWANGDVDQSAMNKCITIKHYNPFNVSELIEEEEVEWTTLES